MLTDQQRIAQLQTKLTEREQATEHYMIGYPGICVAALIAPDCIVMRDDTLGFPFIYCLN